MRMSFLRQECPQAKEGKFSLLELNTRMTIHPMVSSTGENFFPVKGGRHYLVLREVAPLPGDSGVQIGGQSSAENVVRAVTIACSVFVCQIDIDCVVISPSQSHWIGLMTGSICLVTLMSSWLLWRRAPPTP